MAWSRRGNLKLRMLAGVAVSAGLIASIAGCASGGAEGEGPSGTVVWYSSKAPDYNDALIEAFNEQYPDVNVEVMRAITGDITVRYSSERSAGAATADVVTQSDSAFLAEGQDQGWWKTDSEIDEGYPEEAYDDGVLVASYHEMMLGHSTQAFPESLGSWEDLLKPELKGRLVLVDPRGEPGYLAWYQVLAEEYGEDFLSDLAAQEPRFVTSAVPGGETVSSGGADVLAPVALSSINALMESGAPLAIEPFAPSTTIEVYTVVSNEAQNPEGSAAFFEFLSSKEGQEAFNGEVTSSARTDVEGPPALSEGLVPLGDVLPRAQENRDEIVGTLGLE
ncbi:extracellular solute-binding protein [Citricoccus sp. NPDC055426]|uniref:extracellular solute-binding protein n=1 Tax=Citricoccus sp. NPDC055426 TaxID=3155536 RepID=UPI00343BD9AD